MKRLSFALATLGFSFGALAAYPASTDPTLVSVPQLPGGFVVGGSAFYLQPSASNGDLDYATVSFSPAPGAPNSSSVKAVDPGYDWGWGINVGYIFPNTGNDVNVNYFHFDSTDTNGLTLPFSQDFFLFLINNFNDVPFQAGGAASKVQYNLNQVDLTAGQYIDVGCRLILHPNAGLRWAELDRKIWTNGLDIFLFSSGHNLETVDSKSNFSGIGPLAGLDASYYIGGGFGAVAHFDSALLIGDIDASSNIFDGTFTSGSVSSSSTSANVDSTNRLVPVLDAKLGLDYTFIFNNNANSDITLEAGWMVSKYFNAIDHLNTLSTHFPFDGQNVVNRFTSNLGLEGPYASLVVHI